MKIEIRAEPKFYFTLRPDQLDTLVHLSTVHYDAVCRQASRAPEGATPGGFIWVWMYWGADNCSATWRELDICLKILEVGNYVSERAHHHRVFELRLTFTRAMQEASDRVHTFSFESITGPVRGL